MTAREDSEGDDAFVLNTAEEYRPLWGKAARIIGFQGTSVQIKFRFENNTRWFPRDQLGVRQRQP